MQVPTLAETWPRECGASQAPAGDALSFVRGQNQLTGQLTGSVLTPVLGPFWPADISVLLRFVLVVL